MAQAIIARQLGDEYQQFVFWKYALKMLSGKYEIESIRYEDDNVTEREGKIYGAWIKLSKEPVINGWQAPNTFKELALAFRNQNLNLRDILEKIIPRLRDAKKHVLMIGFPIPERVGEERSIMHWESLFF